VTVIYLKMTENSAAYHTAPRMTATPLREEYSSRASLRRCQMFITTTVTVLNAKNATANSNAHRFRAATDQCSVMGATAHRIPLAKNTTQPVGPIMISQRKLTNTNRAVYGMLGKTTR